MADRLQLEILRAFHLLSRPGKEVGGILLGRTEFTGGRILTFVEDFKPVACAHLNGPSFALTDGETANFEAALARERACSKYFVVGYYRSHNRPGLSLSADDLRLIQRYFPGSENLFLLIRTLPNRTCTAGFFFWKNGRIQSEFTNSEAPLIPTVSYFADRSPTSHEDLHDIPVAPPASVPSAAEDQPPAASPKFVGLPDRNRRLIRGLVLTAGAAITFAVGYLETTAPRAIHARDGMEIPLAHAKSEPPAPTAIRVPASTVNQNAPISPSRQKTEIPKAGKEAAKDVAAPPPRNEAKLPTPSPSAETAAVRSPVANEPSTPPSPKPATIAQPVANTNPVATTAERTVSTAQSIPAETASAPPVPVTPPPTPSVTPEIEAPPTDARKPVVPPVSTPAPPTSPAAHVFIGPQVIHQVTPAVPRGVGPAITTDVQVDVAVVIDAKGKVAGARIASTKGAAAGLLTIEALKAAQLFRFRPAQENGHNVVSSMVLTFRFARTAK
jgi:hypothetical protein